jgi:hypothetical protein
MFQHGSNGFERDKALIVIITHRINIPQLLNMFIGELFDDQRVDLADIFVLRRDVGKREELLAVRVVTERLLAVES